jgi:drug/metabolite transporter (DMT)-like permease
VNDVSNENLHTYVFLYQMINSTSIIFSGLLYFISIIRRQTDNKANIGTLSERSNSSDYSFMAKKNPNRLLEYSIICFMSIIITLYNVLKGYGTGHKTLEKRLYFLFFFCLINIFLFKKPFYRHQKFSLSIAFVGMVIIFALFFIYLNKSNYDYIYDVLLFFGSFLYSLYLVLVKYMSENKGYSPFLLLFLIGIISTAATVVGFLILSHVRLGNINYVSNIFHCRPDIFVCFGNLYEYIIGYFLINAVLQILIFLVCYYFSPEVFAISDIISPFLSCITNIAKGKEKIVVKIVFDIIGYIIITIGSFIYNEIIVCNFWDLNKNTWKSIVKKANDDYLGRVTDVSDSIADDDCDIEMTSSKSRNSNENRNSNELTERLSE